MYDECANPVLDLVKCKAMFRCLVLEGVQTFWRAIDSQLTCIT